MAISKVILNGETLMDVTSDTVESDKLLSGETATKNDGTKITGSYSANLAPLTVISNNDEEQVFDGSPILTEINRAMFETSEISSGDSNTLTSSLDWIETGGNVSVVIGNRYHLSGWFGTGDTNETAQRIFFDTDWVASSNLTSIPFTTKPGYSDDESDLFDGSIEFIEIKLSITQMTITATAPFVVFTDYNNGSGMYLSVSEIGEALDGYVPVIVEPIKLISADIDLITEKNINSHSYAIDHLAIYKSTAIITCTLVSDWNNFNEPVLENCVIGNKYLIDFIIYNSSGQYVHAYCSRKPYKYDGTSFVADLVNREGDWYGTITIENTRFKIESTRISNGDIIKYFTISDYIDGFSYVTVSNTSLQDKTVSPSESSQIVTADSGYYGLSQVTVNAIPSAYLIPSGTYSISSNGTYDIGSYKSVSVDVAGGGGSGDGYTADQIAMRTISGSISGNASVIGSNVFQYCSALTAANFPSATSIGSYAFYQCSSLTTANFPSATSIGNSAFYKCSALTTISFPSVVTIGSSAFDRCTSLTTISFPQATNIGANAFEYCTSLTTISFPQATRISSGAFNNCSALTTISFPSVTTISTSAFYMCKSLTTISFPLATSIGSNAFNRCTSLTTISFPSATSIGSYAFYYCESLTTISFPQATRIDANAFGYCYNLLSLYLLGSSIISLININAFNSTPISNYTTSTGGVYGSIFVPASLYNSYITATNWATYSARIVSV